MPLPTTRLHGAIPSSLCGVLGAISAAKDTFLPMQLFFPTVIAAKASAAAQFSSPYCQFDDMLLVLWTSSMFAAGKAFILSSTAACMQQTWTPNAPCYRWDGWAGLGWAGLGWDGMGWCDGMGWDGMGWDWDGMGWDGMGWDGMGWDGIGMGWDWDGMGWDGWGWDGMGWDGMGWDGFPQRLNIFEDQTPEDGCCLFRRHGQRGNHPVQGLLPADRAQGRHDCGRPRFPSGARCCRRARRNMAMLIVGRLCLGVGIGFANQVPV